MAEKCKRSRRRLTGFEIDEARLVFGDNLQYERIWIHECNRFPNFIDDIGRKLARREPRGPESHNAITLGNHLYFPIVFPAERVRGDSLTCWFMHELTHAWQYQQMGWKYLYLAVSAQMRLGSLAYDFGKEPGLKSRRKEGAILKDFNLEQQADIVRYYYQGVCREGDMSVYQPYIDDIPAGL